jgi:glycosyltransferase involved in cell wall biosynthesis
LVRALESHGVGGAIYATDLAEPAASRARAGLTAEDVPPGAESVDIRLFPAGFVRRVAYSSSLARNLRRDAGRFDVIHVHMLFLHPTLAAYRAAVRSRLPYVVTPHGAFQPHLRANSRLAKAMTTFLWQGRMLDQAAALHYASDDEAQGAAVMGFRPPPVVIPFGLDVSAYRVLPDPTSFRARYVDGRHGPIVLSIGRLAARKAPDLLISAFAHVAGEMPEALLVLAGPDDEGIQRQLKQLAHGFGLDDRVVFTGMLAGADKLGALAAADVWALASPAESFGVAALEALAASRPVVVSPFGTLAKEIREAGAGVVCDRSATGFGRAIVRLLRDDDERARVSSRANEFAWRYDIARVAGRFAAFYDGLQRSPYS